MDTVCMERVDLPERERKMGKRQLNLWMPHPVADALAELSKPLGEKRKYIALVAAVVSLLEKTETEREKLYARVGAAEVSKTYGPLIDEARQASEKRTAPSKLVSELDEPSPPKAAGGRKGSPSPSHNKQG
jgi:hypothetical protein